MRHDLEVSGELLLQHAQLAHSHAQAHSVHSQNSGQSDHTGSDDDDDVRPRPASMLPTGRTTGDQPPNPTLDRYTVLTDDCRGVTGRVLNEAGQLCCLAGQAQDGRAWRFGLGCPCTCRCQRRGHCDGTARQTTRSSRYQRVFDMRAQSSAVALQTVRRLQSV
jgi:hypothetical protein